MTKKESIASMANADALTITPETSAGTALTSTIRKSGENVKKYSAEPTEEAKWQAKVNSAMTMNDAKLEAGQNQNRKYSREYKRVNVSKQAWSQIQNQRMLKYGNKFDTMPSMDYIFANDNLFVINNYDEMSFSVTRKINPAKDKVLADKMVEAFKNGSITNTREYNSIAKMLWNNARRGNGDNVHAGNGRAAGDNARLDDKSERAADRGNATYKGRGDNGVSYSREPESITELRRQNRELKKRVDYWKGQTQRTKVKTVRQSDVNRLAREVIDMSESDLKPQDITERLSKLGEHILNEKELRYTDIAEMAQDIAEDVVSNATTIVNEDDVQTHNRLYHDCCTYSSE